MKNIGKNMNYNKELFYTLDEVRKLLLKTEDRSYSKDESIVRLIHTDRLTPYIRYNGPVDIVTEAEDVPEKSIKKITDSLYHTINTQMCNLEIGETIHPYDYDSNTSLKNTKYFIEKLLFCLNAKRAKNTLGVSILAEGVFRLLPLSVTYLRGDIEVSLGPKMFMPEIIEADFNNQERSNNETEKIKGYTLSSTEEDNYELIFSKQDVQYIITVIETSHELPTLRDKLLDANRVISQKNKEIEELKQKLRTNQLKESTEDLSDIKDSAYRLIFALKHIVFKLDQELKALPTEKKNKFDFANQSNIVNHIADWNIAKLSKSNIEIIFAETNRRNLG